jgi:branched-chain amino acid transport system ATP-binding protein
MKALELNEVNAYYGKAHILHDLSLSLDEGELVALLGRNGAGKSTTLHSVMGFASVRSGSIRLFEQESTQFGATRVVGLGVGFVPEGRRVFSNLTVLENLMVPIDKPGPWNIAEIFKLFPRLEERKTSKGGQLSGGEQEMLSISRALLLNPRLLLLDEPSQGLAPLIVHEVFGVIDSVRKQGTSILLIEQNVRAALRLADRAYVLDTGRLTYSGTVAELEADEARLRQLAGVVNEERKKH